MAKRAPYLQILADLIAWQERQIFALGVEVRLNTFVEAEEILAEQTDALIIATGGANPGDGRQARIPGELPYGIDSPNVMNPVELLTGPAQPMAGKKALVFDDVGRYDAIAAAEFLQSQGAGVNFVTSQTSSRRKCSAPAAIPNHWRGCIKTHSDYGSAIIWLALKPAMYGSDRLA